MCNINVTSLMGLFLTALFPKKFLVFTEILEHECVKNNYEQSFIINLKNTIYKRIVKITVVSERNAFFENIFRSVIFVNFISLSF